jgi:hypothetical protein
MASAIDPTFTYKGGERPFDAWSLPETNSPRKPACDERAAEACSLSCIHA